VVKKSKRAHNATRTVNNVALRFDVPLRFRAQKCTPEQTGSEMLFLVTMLRQALSKQKAKAREFLRHTLLPSLG